MATITVTDAVGTGLDPVFAAVRTVEMEDKPFGEGAFGKVHRCGSVNGSPIPRMQAVKLLVDDGSGSAERGLRTTRKLQERLAGKIRSSGAEAVTRAGALTALPQFSFRGVLNGRPVLGYSAHLLTEGWTEFETILNHPDRNERNRLRNTFYNLPLHVRLRMAHDLVQGFALLRELGFIYADLNPKNFFVNMAQGRLCLIDYEGGAVNEDPETFGKMGEWLAPEIQAQLKDRNAGPVKVDLNTDTWAVAIGVHFMLFQYHPVFFLQTRGPENMRNYFARHTWPEADKTDPNFREPATYDSYRRKLKALPPELTRGFFETVNHGWNNRSKRLTYSQWERAIAPGMVPPVVPLWSRVSDRCASASRDGLKLLVAAARRVQAHAQKVPTPSATTAPGAPSRTTPGKRQVAPASLGQRARRGALPLLVIVALVLVGWQLRDALPGLSRWHKFFRTEEFWRTEYQQFRDAHRVVYNGQDSIIVLRPTGRETRNYFVPKGGKYRLDYGSGKTSSERTAFDPVYLNTDRNWIQTTNANGEVRVALRVRGNYSMHIITPWRNITFNAQEDDVEFTYLKDDLASFRAQDTDTMAVPRHVWDAIMTGGRTACCWPQRRSPW